MPKTVISGAQTARLIERRARKDAEAKAEARKRRDLEKTKRRKRIKKAEAAGKYTIAGNLNWYMKDLEERYRHRTPTEYFKGMTPEEISKEAELLHKKFSDISARILAVSRSGYEKVKNIHRETGRGDAKRFIIAGEGIKDTRFMDIHQETTRDLILGKKYLMNFVYKRIAEIQAKINEILKYWQYVKEHGRLPPWRPWSRFSRYNNKEIAYEFIEMRKDAMDLLREADEIINKLF